MYGFLSERMQGFILSLRGRARVANERSEEIIGLLSRG